MRRDDAYQVIFEALAHPARRHILMTLYLEGGVMTAGEIAAIFAHAWPTTTRHLKVLEEANLVENERQGRAQLYRLRTVPLVLVQDWLANLTKRKRG